MLSDKILSIFFPMCFSTQFLVPNFSHHYKTSTFFGASALIDLTNFLSKFAVSNQYKLATICLGNWVWEHLRKISLMKSNVSSPHLESNDFYQLSSITSLLKQTLLLSAIFMHFSRAGVFAQRSILFDIFLFLDKCEKVTTFGSWLLLPGCRIFQRAVFFLNGFNNQQWAVQLFWSKIDSKGYTMHFKRSNWSSCLVLYKRICP